MRFQLNFTPSVWKWKRKDKVFSAGGGWGKMLEAMPKEMHCKWSTSQESSQEPSSRRICMRRVCWIKPSLRASGCKRLLKTMTSSWPFRIKCLISITWRRWLWCQCGQCYKTTCFFGDQQALKLSTSLRAKMSSTRWLRSGKNWKKRGIGMGNGTGAIIPIMFTQIHTPWNLPHLLLITYAPINGRQCLRRQRSSAVSETPARLHVHAWLLVHRHGFEYIDGNDFKTRMGKDIEIWAYIRNYKSYHIISTYTPPTMLLY